MTVLAADGSVVEAPAGNLEKPAEGANNGSVAPTGKWFDGLSEGNRKIADTKGWTKADTSADVVLTAYSELERLQGDSLRVPAADAPKEEWEKFHSKLPEDMRPIASPDKLEFKRPEGLPENVPYSAELAAASKPWMHEAGLSAKQSQVMHDKFVSYMAEQTTQQLAAVGKSVEDTHDALVKDWGPADSDGFKQKLELANRAMKELGLVDSYKGRGILLPDGALTEPQIAKAFAAVGEAMFKEDSIDGGKVIAGSNPFKRDANGNRNMTAISALVGSDPQRARQMAKEAGENPDAWVPNNPL